jgi:hypothetical protein
VSLNHLEVALIFAMRGQQTSSGGGERTIPIDPVSKQFTVLLFPNTATALWHHNTITVAPGQTQVVDVISGGLTDQFGQPVTMSRYRALVIKASEHNTDPVSYTLGNFHDAEIAGVVVPNGLSIPFIDGARYGLDGYPNVYDSHEYPLVPATGAGDMLTLAHAGGTGGQNASVDVWVFGE